MKETVDYKDRVMTIEGDMNELGLGLSAKDLELLQTTVDIIFHGAATVKFNETLDRAMTINVRGTKEVLTLANNCVNIKVFLKDQYFAFLTKTFKIQTGSKGLLYHKENGEYWSKCYKLF